MYGLIMFTRRHNYLLIIYSLGFLLVLLDLDVALNDELLGLLDLFYPKRSEVVVSAFLDKEFRPLELPLF